MLVVAFDGVAAGTMTVVDVVAIAECNLDVVDILLEEEGDGQKLKSKQIVCRAHDYGDMRSQAAEDGVALLVRGWTADRS
jgi:hypothetical protein